jgi:exopolyphosphatase / guanosine-5'-triphosphate,3'-diphosphate pyrophosphatase
VRVGVVDVGSNTVRLLVTDGGEAVEQRRAVLGLGASIERVGSIPEPDLSGAARCVAEFVAVARECGAERVEVLVTSPGRQAANGDALLDALAGATRLPVRLLGPEEEGRLAFVGALASRRGANRKSVAVCDVGGGSAQVAVGTRRDGPAWIRSIDLGSRRLTSRLLEEDPPGRDAVERAREEVERLLHPFAPPLPQIALAVGGSARALRRVVGPRLGADELARATRLLATTPTRRVVADFAVDPGRARTLAAGAVILAAIQDRLGVPFEVARGGVREGAVAELAERLAAAA